MYLVGVDLAWGARKPTGIAVLDAEGRLQHIGTAVQNEEIVDDMAPYVDGECLVAIDAPLVVKNATGRRAAEKMLNADFQHFEAGAHSANTGIPHLRDLRGAWLVDRLQLDMNPLSTGARRAIEVYPHPATVVLFELERTLKYKRGRGDTSAERTADRRGELLKFMSLIEKLSQSPVPMTVDHNEWAALREAVTQAVRPVELSRAEDKVDAVLCAYIAMYFLRRRGDIAIYGDPRDDYAAGYIVSPALPEHMKRAHRMTPATEESAS